jgi:hypothetical protein
MIKFLLFFVVFFISFSSNMSIDGKEDLSMKKSANVADISFMSSDDNSIFFDDIVYPENVEDNDYFELLGTEIDDFMELLKLNFDFSDSNDFHFINQNANKLILKAIHDGIIDDVLNQRNVRFSGTIHSQISSDAIDLLNFDGKTGAYNLFNNYKSAILNGSSMPDVDEKAGGTHYYNYGTEQQDGYYMNNKDQYSISARTRFEEHYFTAINAYKNGLILVAMDEIGRALHYLQDVASTPHSTGLTVVTDWCPHVYYENWLKLVYPGNSIYSATTANAHYNKLLNLGIIGTILNEVSEFSYNFREEIEDFAKNTEDVNYSYYVLTASECLPYAQMITAAVLNRFYEDVTNSSRKVSYIKDDSIYFIKNVYSENYIDVKSWSTDNEAITHPYSFHGDTNQQFKAVMQDDGSFKFIPMHAQNKKLHISRSLTNFEELNITTNGHNFRPVYYKNGMYKIIPEYDTVGNTAEVRYYKYPIIDQGNIISIKSIEIWNPSNLAYYWEFQEAPSLSVGNVNTYLFKNETKKVMITVPSNGYYSIETISGIDTKFLKLSYREGCENTNINELIDVISDDEGDGLNAKYSNVYLETGKTYILTLKGYSVNTAGNITINVNSISDWYLIRTNPYEITDDGRFNNNYDIIDLSSLL